MCGTAAGSPEWRYLALEDPLPAGVEAIQDTTAYPLERPAADSWWSGSRVEYRDSRTVFFQETFESGRYEFAYLVKVIAPGQFRAVPAQISRCKCRECTLRLNRTPSQLPLPVLAIRSLGEGWGSR